MRNPPEIPFSLQSKFLLLYLAAIVCALWMRSDPNLAFACLAAGPVFLLLSRVSLSWFPGWLRQFCQLGVAVFAVYWMQLQLAENPLDTSLIELTAILLPALFLGGTFREHSLLWLGCIGFTGYGGLHPARSAFLPSFIIVILVSILILYQTRITLLARISKQHLLTTDAKTPYWGNWFYRLIHFGLVLLTVLLLSTQFSLRSKTRSVGLIPVSFRTDQEQQFPEIWQKWAAPTKELLIGKDAGKSLDSDKDPTLQDDQARSRMQQGTFAVDGDNGSGSGMGQDLVFRAFTPAKLYWVVQLYDTFDGSQWNRSLSMSKGKNALDTYRSSYQSEVVQNISIVKAVSRFLPYAYRPNQVIWNDKSFQENIPMGIIRREDYVSYQLRNETPPPLPWQYTVVSTVPDPERSSLLRAWREPPRNFGWNYRQLPRKVLSKRMLDLAEELTEHAETPHEKALAIRDYLRENYAYTLTPPSPPKNKELTDFFLFESREGFCQHFAQAFTLLARMAGLHSRLATGYSPGNFNLLSNCFEVYEYHGHAWTQIFIEPYGWLTFDGTPPGALRLEENPPLLKPLLDPFGEKWQVETPELSARSPLPSQPAKGSVAQSIRQPAGKKESPQSDIQKKVSEFYDQVYSKAITDNADANPNVRQILKAGLQTALLTGKSFLQKAMTQMRSLAHAIGERISRFVNRILDWLMARTLADLIQLSLLLVLVWQLWRHRERWWGYLLWRWRLLQCDHNWRKLARQPISAQGKIEACQKLIANWLDLAGLKRQPARDLLEHAAMVQQRLPVLTEEYIFIAECAAETWYSPHQPDPSLSERVLQHTARFRRKISPFLNHRRLRRLHT